MLILYGIAACDTCRSALRDLTARGRAPVLHDVRRDGLSPEFIARCHLAFGDALINRRSTTWRGLSHADRAMDPAALLGRFPAVMKRPIIDDGTRLRLGWTNAVKTALL